MIRTVLGRSLLLAALTAIGSPVWSADPPRVLRIAHYETRGAAPAAQRLLEESLRDVGVVPVAVEVPLARALFETDKGEILDADPARSMEAISEFRNIVAVPEPIYRLQLGAFIRHGSPPVLRWSDLRSRQVIAFSGSVVLDHLIVSNSIMHVTRADTYITAVFMLATGRGDVAILPRREVVAVLDELPVHVIEPSGPMLSDVPLFFVLNKRYADLALPLAEAIRQHRARNDAMANAR